jgi:heme A synthase
VTCAVLGVSYQGCKGAIMRRTKLPDWLVLSLVGLAIITMVALVIIAADNL